METREIMKIFIPLLISFACSNGQLLDALIGNECLQKVVPDGMCAVLYDDDGCEGWAKPIPTGYTELTFRYRNDAEAVVVRKGCIFTGYDHAGTTRAERGESYQIDARNFNKPYNKWKNLGRKSLDDEISAVTCECPSSQPSSVRGSQVGPRRVDPASNIAASRCPMIPRTACAILFEEDNCRAGDWEPITMNSGEQKSFSLRKSLLNLKYKNDIESVALRDGCTFEAYDDSDYSDDGISVTAQSGDLFFNLKNHRNDKFDDLHNDIESVRCRC